MNIKKLGLIGYPLTHSFSAKYFADKFEREGIKGFSYENFEIPKIEDFPNILKNKTPKINEIILAKVPGKKGKYPI